MIVKICGSLRMSPCPVDYLRATDLSALSSLGPRCTESWMLGAHFIMTLSPASHRSAVCTCRCHVAVTCPDRVSLLRTSSGRRSSRTGHGVLGKLDLAVLCGIYDFCGSKTDRLLTKTTTKSNKTNFVVQLI